MLSFFIILVVGLLVVMAVNTSGTASNKEVVPVTKEDKKEIEDLLYTPRKTLSKETLLSMLELTQQYDDFTNTSGGIKFNNVGGKDKKYLPMYFYEDCGVVGMEHIGLSFSIFDKDVFLVVSSYLIELSKGDELTFLFVDSSVLTLVLDEDSDIKIYYIFLTDEHLHKFATEKLDKWKLVQKEGYTAGDNSMFCEVSDIPSKEASQLILMKMASMISEVVAGHPHEEVTGR